MSWGQPFRLRHMATGKFLGVVDRSGIMGDGRDCEDESGWSLQLEGKKKKKRRPHQLTLLGPGEAAREATAFYFTHGNAHATVRYSL